MHLGCEALPGLSAVIHFAVIHSTKRNPQFDGTDFTNSFVNLAYIWGRCTCEGGDLTTMRKAVSIAGLAAFFSLSLYISAPIATSASSSTNLKNITFNKHVAPILFKNCASCHRPGDLAPMSLLSYKDARPWARSIKEKVATHQMPPWHADPHYGEFANDRRLSRNEIDTIVAWVDQGAKEGEPRDLPPAPPLNEGWHIGKPDAVLTMPEEITFDATGPDEYRYITIPTNFKQDVWVQAAEARPGNRKIVHHIIAFVTMPQPKGTKSFFQPSQEQIKKMQERIIFYEDGRLMRTKPDMPVFDDGCATAEGGSGVFADGTGSDGGGNFLCGQSPGRDVDAWPAGLAKKIPAGANILLQIHYSRSGSVEKDRSSIGLVFSKEPPDKSVNTQPVANFHFKIPPGAENHQASACYTFKNDVHILSLMPHMHVRGKDMSIKAFYPDGRSEVLLEVPNYSFSWQTNYYFKNPVAIPKGTKIMCIAHFDNSTNNKYNPDPTKAIRFGDPTYDEMLIGFVDYTVDAQHLTRPAAAGGSK